MVQEQNALCLHLIKIKEFSFQLYAVKYVFIWCIAQFWFTKTQIRVLY